MSTDSVQTRRRFLRTGLATAGGIALGACGGGGDVAAAPDTAGATDSVAQESSLGTVGGSAAPQAAGTPGTYVVQATSAQPEVFAPGSVTPIATGARGMVAQVSPDLPPGRTLAISADGDVSIAAAIGSPVVTIDRPWVIEVMDSPIATIVNATQNKTYPYAAPGSWPRYDSQPSTRWNAVMGEANPGDIIEISPGAVQAVPGDRLMYENSALNSTLLGVLKPDLTLRNMTGRGRWTPYLGTDQMAGDITGITIYAPGASGNMSRRGSFVIEGFYLDNWGVDDGVRIMARAAVHGSFDNLHTAVTLRNFKIGKPAPHTSFSGINGGAETLTIEDGHVYDCGNGSGQNHNAYVSARTMTLRGMRFERSRGWSGTPWSGGSVTLEGHLLKASAVAGSIEGCLFDCAALGDQSELLQMKAGGNWTVRGSVFIDSQAPNVANGAINMCREYSMDGVTPNFEWWAGSEGNSLLFERNVYIGHYPRPIIWFFDSTGTSLQALYPAGDGSKPSERKLQSLVVRDNIAMVAATQRYGNWMLAGFPGTNKSMWIYRDPNAGTNWEARGNSVESYDVNEAAFSGRALKVYRRTAGAIAASGGAVATRRFQYPHGSVLRSDSLRGLG